jgi:hypothetical protein
MSAKAGADILHVALELHFLARLDQRDASFETAATRLPQDEEFR